MKHVKSLLVTGLIATLLWSCSDSSGRYVDLTTGKSIELVKDDNTGLMVHKDSKEPVYIYVDTKSKDTIYGKTGKVINGHVVVDRENKYVFDDDIKVVEPVSTNDTYKSGDYKVEVEKDGDIKIKDGDKKIKIDGETGERKVKNDD